MNQFEEIEKQVKKAKVKKIQQGRKIKEKNRIQPGKKGGRIATLEEVAQEAKLQRQKAKNFFETGYSETDEERYKRERKKTEKTVAVRKAREERLVEQLDNQIKKEQSRGISIHNISKVNLPCTLCGTSSCKNKNSCIVTSD